MNYLASKVVSVCNIFGGCGGVFGLVAVCAIRLHDLAIGGVARHHPSSPATRSILCGAFLDQRLLLLRSREDPLLFMGTG